MMLRRLISQFVFACIIFSAQATQAAIPVQTMVIFGDSLSDVGNTTHLMKALRQEESPAYLVRPLKAFVINRMIDFANDYYVPQFILDSGIATVTEFFDQQLAPMLADLVGKVRQVPVLPGKPYWNARFSNGRVWNEYLAPMLDVDKEDEDHYINKAFGGSWTATYDYQLTTWNLIRHPLLSLKALIVGKLIPPSLGLIVQAYILERNQLDDEAVYFIYSGSNDYVNLLRFEDNYNPAIMNDYVNNVVNGTQAALNKLYQRGARRLVILGVPPVGDAPKFVNTPDRAVLNNATERHNQVLQQMLTVWEVNHPQSDVLYIDLQPMFKKFSVHPEQYGFSELKNPCIDVKLPMFADIGRQSPFVDNFVLQYAQVLQYQDQHFLPGERNYHVCDDPNSHLFWDEIHPSTRAHKILAQEVCKQMAAHGYQATC